MKSASACIRIPLAALLLGLLAFAPFNVATAQDNAFLACDKFTDRGQRIACLEDALEAATAEPAEPAPTRPPAATAVTPVPAERAAPVAPAAEARPASAAGPARAAEPNVEVEGEVEEGPSLLDRLRNFGRDDTVAISSDAEGQDQLHDTITALESRRDLWIVTLSSGQVWMQEYPRTLNLREGDKIRIYQAGLGDGYRLATDRLSGFIRVKRMR